MFEDASIKFNIVLLPYLVEGWDEAICLVRSPWMMEIAAEGRKKGFHIPAVGISQGFRAHGSKKRAIRTVADFDGLKIRVPNAQEVFHRMENALGANPQGIAQSETYSGAAGPALSTARRRHRLISGTGGSTRSSTGSPSTPTPQGPTR